MRPRNRDGFEIAIICALPLEAGAVKAIFDETYDILGRTYGKQVGDDNYYTTGRIDKHNVVLCHMPGMGKSSAASASSSLKTSFPRIKLALVVGICGGVPFPAGNTEIVLGDVLISDGVVEYDFGRQGTDDFRRKKHPNDTLGRPTREIRAFLAGLKSVNRDGSLSKQISKHLMKLKQHPSNVWKYPGADKDTLLPASYRHKHRSTGDCICFTGRDQVCEEATKADCEMLGCMGKPVERHRLNRDDLHPLVHIGKIASADTVMKSGEHRDKLNQTEGIIGLEMEGAGVWDNIPCVIIKGVCDYADSHKNKTWQSYAAASAASCARVFLEHWTPASKEITLESFLEEQGTDIGDFQALLSSLSAQARAVAVFMLVTLFYFREVFIAVHSRLTKLITTGSENLAILEDAHLRRFPIHLDTVNSWKILELILEQQFEDMPGLAMVKRKFYALEDSITHKRISPKSAFRSCFRPGRRILMSMRFHHPQHESSTCPSCHALNRDLGHSDVCCSVCGMQYRRLTDLNETDGNQALTAPRHNIKELTSDSESGDSTTGPRTIAEADTDDDIGEFKRVEIVAPPSVEAVIEIESDTPTAAVNELLASNEPPSINGPRSTLEVPDQHNIKGPNGTYTSMYDGSDTGESYATNRRRRRKVIPRPSSRRD